MNRLFSIDQIKKMSNKLKLLSICVLLLFPSACGSLITEGNKPVLYPGTLNVVAFGDSITSPKKNMKVFAQRIHDLLAASGVNTTIINSGIGGSHTGRLSDNNMMNIKHALDRFEDDVLAKNPNLVIIGFGANDAYIDKAPDGPSRIPLNKFKENLIYMIKSLNNKGAKVILIAPNALGKNKPDYQHARLAQYAQAVREISKSFNTGLVDNYAAFLNYQKNTGGSVDDLMTDGIHPNDRGHEIIAAIMLKEILNVIKL